MPRQEVLIFDQKSVQTHNTPKDGLFRQKQPEWQHPVILVASETLRKNHGDRFLIPDIRLFRFAVCALFA